MPAIPILNQNVTAASGFGYGVIGADIHVLGNGLPLYLLANWRPAPETDRAWLRELPSRMLNSHRAVVPFTGRGGELAGLRRWRETGQPLAVRWLHGPGGQGKTRLAAQFAADSAAAGWKVIVAVHGPDADWSQPRSQDLRVNDAPGLVMIVDYADRWLPTNLTWLFKNALLHRAGVLVRVLMVARNPEAWPAVRAILNAYHAVVSTQALPSLIRESGERAGMFAAARDSFAAVYGLPDAHRIEPPGQLGEEEFGLTLTVHMAALVAVDSCATGARPPPDAAGLTIYLLDREQLHWARLYADRAVADSSGGTSFRTPPEVMNRAVFTAVLTGPLRPDDAGALLEKLELPDPRQALADQAICYPSVDPGRGTVLEPLYPDRLAEDFLALTMPGHTAEYPAQPWAGPAVARLLERHGNEHEPAAWTARAITFLAAAAQRWPHLGNGYLYPLLLGDPQLAVDAGNAALTAIADLPDVTAAVLEAIEARFPDHRHVDLDTGMAALTTRLADELVAVSPGPEERARIRNDQAVRLSHAGYRHEAVTAAEDAVAVMRPLAEENHKAYDASLAGALSNLSACLAELDRWAESAAAIHEVVMIQRLVAKQDPFHRTILATSLSSLGVGLLRLGRPQEALAAVQEAVNILRRPARADPADQDEALATSLSHLAASLAAAGRPRKALAAIREAVRILRRLAKANPAAYEPALAASLSNLGAGLSGTGRSAKALAASREAVTVWRRLAKANPAAHEPSLAASLANLSVDQWHLGLREGSLSSNGELVSIYRRLARADPVAYQAALAASLSDLGGRLSEIGRLDEALAAAREAVEIGRPLTGADPAQDPDFAMALDNLSVILGRLGFKDEAVATDIEAVTVYRRLAQASPAENEPELAHTLSNLGASLSHLGRWEEAHAAAEDAVGVYRRLARAGRGHEGGLARSLFNLARICSEMERPADAVRVAQEAVAAYRRLIKADRAVGESGLASSLINLSLSLKALGRPEEALASLRQAVSIRRRQAGTAPAAHEPGLAQAEDNLAVLLSESGLHEEALTVTAQAVALRRGLAKKRAPACQLRLARSLWIYAQVRAAGQRELPRAFSSIKDACAIHQQWTEPLPAEYSGDLVGALSCAVWVLHLLGRDTESADLRHLIEAGELARALELVARLGPAGSPAPSR